jgi:molybdate transport system substrate-binding protein
MRATMMGLVFVMVVLSIAVFGSVPQLQGAFNASSSVGGVELAIAAPDELNSALTELARLFEQKTGERIHFTFTDSASLLKQVRNGSAFDAVFLPDISDVLRLEASGKVTSISVTEYARDQMFLCFAPGVHIQPRLGNPLLLLTDKRIAHIVIANPKNTAFGKITVQALTAVHIYDAEFKRKLLVAEDVAEAAQFLKKGDADVVLLPGSAIRAYQLTSMRTLPIISTHVYTPIRKGAAVLRRAKHPRQALAFLKFAASPEGRDVFRRAGFEELRSATAGIAK